LTKESLCGVIYNVFEHCTNYVILISLAKRMEIKEIKVFVRLAILVAA
jgi:hypothetical protein